jgi:hypothetical protein
MSSLFSSRKYPRKFFSQPPRAGSLAQKLLESLGLENPCAPLRMVVSFILLHFH